MNNPQNNILLIELGEREWSTIPDSVSIENWFYKKSANQDLYLRAYSKFYPLIRVVKQNKKLLSTVTKITTAASVLAMAFFVQDKLNKFSATPNKQITKIDSSVMLKPKVIQPTIKQEPLKTENANELQNQLAAQVVETQPSLITDNYQQTVIKKIVDVEQDKKTEKIKQMLSKLTIAQKKAQTNLPAPPTIKIANDKPVKETAPIKGSSVAITVKPPLPAHLKSAYQNNMVNPADLLNRNTMMAITESPEQPNRPPISVVQKQDLDSNEGKTNTSKVESNKVISVPEVKPLPVYKIIAITKNSVVISDETNPMPRQFKVGSTMPSGEVIQSVNESKGVVVTDKRSIKSN